MSDYYTPAEIDASNRVEFVTSDSKGKPLAFRTPEGVEVAVVGGPRPVEWSVQGGPGLSGATRKLVRVGLAEGTITLKFGGQNAGEAKAAFRSGMFAHFRPPAPNENAKVYTVSHPLFASYSGGPVKHVVCLEGPPEQWDRASQMATYVYKWGEWRKQAPVLSSAITAGQTKDGSKAKSAAKASLDAAVAANSAQISQLSTQLTSQ